MERLEATGRGIEGATPDPPESHASEHLDSVLSGRLRQALLLTGIILAVELVGGILSGSLALLSDAGHVTTDVLALGLAWYAVEQTKRPADETRTFGYHRAGILAATANGATLIVLVLVIAYEAVQRLAHPQPVQGGIVIVSALVGVAVNAYIAFNFRGQGGNLNVRAAVLHAVGDMIASIGVIIAGAIILLTGWTFIDPIVSIFIAALIGWNAFRIVLETVNILLEGTPRGLDMGDIRKVITGVEGVLSAHDVHVWCISSEHTAMSCHIVVADQPLAAAEGVMRAVEGAICERFGIGHTTVQLEYLEPCSGEADHLSEHNHPHHKLARLALTERRRTPLSRRKPQPVRATRPGAATSRS
jgi:cobalt-zinc-cadmium efflux system protein